MEYKNDGVSGQCPKCGHDDLEYSTFEIEGTYYPVTCQKCKWEGREVHSMEFEYMEDDAGVVEEVMSTKEIIEELQNAGEWIIAVAGNEEAKAEHIQSMLKGIQCAIDKL